MQDMEGLFLGIHINYSLSCSHFLLLSCNLSNFSLVLERRQWLWWGGGGEWFIYHPMIFSTPLFIQQTLKNKLLVQTTGSWYSKPNFWNENNLLSLKSPIHTNKNILPFNKFISVMNFKRLFWNSCSCWSRKSHGHKEVLGGRMLGRSFC